jgi:hypothetical protein
VRGEDVFQINELVDPYQVTLSTELEEIMIFVSLRTLMFMLLLMS